MNESLGFKEISPYETENALKLIGKDWMLITVRDGDSANAMTASWGCLGVLWGNPVAVCFIRPQRYTHKLLESETRLSLAFLGAEYREALNICGKYSGRDCDKLKLAGLSTCELDGIPVIGEARVVLGCKKLYVGKLEESCFVDKTLTEFYNAGDFHSVYVLEIEKAYAK